MKKEVIKMKKMILILSLITTLTYAKVYDYLQTEFSAKVTENSVVNNSKKKKVYNLVYKPSKLELKVVEPKLNSGEIYTYSKGKKTLYSPKLKQTVNQSVGSQDESLYSILTDLANLEDAKTQTKGNKKYTFENGVLKNIIAKDYKIYFENYLNNKPTKIKFESNSIIYDYTIEY